MHPWRRSGPHRMHKIPVRYPLCHAPTPHTHTYLPWPELSPLHNVFKIVADDVGLLEEQSHGVGQVVILSHLLPLKTRCRKQLRQTNTHQTSYIVAVLWSRERSGGEGGGGGGGWGGVGEGVVMVVVRSRDRFTLRPMID